MRREVRTLPHTKGERDVIALHNSYCQWTGFEITLTTDRVRMWSEWLRFKTPSFTAQDLQDVIGYLRAAIRRSERNEGALKFLNLIGKVDSFEEDLALARKWRRASSAQPRRSVSAVPVQRAEADDRTPEQRAADFRRQVTGE